MKGTKIKNSLKVSEESIVKQNSCILFQGKFVIVQKKLWDFPEFF